MLRYDSMLYQYMERRKRKKKGKGQELISSEALGKGN